jgi:hypothetical protein
MKAVMSLVLAGLGLTAMTVLHAAAPDWEEFGIDPNVSYSGTRHIETDEGSFEIQEYRAPKMFRADLAYEGQQGSMISREDRQVAYMIMPAMNAYMEIPTDQVLEATYHAQVVERTEVGRETLLGHQTTKYHAVFQDSDDGRSTGHMWVTEHGIPIRMDMVYEQPGVHGERVVTELRDLKVAPQDPALFELPDDYQALDVGNIGAMVQGMMGGDGERTDGSSEAQPAGKTVTDVAAEAAREEASRSAVEEARKATREGLRSIFGR